DVAAGRPCLTIYRSRTDGAWFSPFSPPATVPITDLEDAPAVSAAALELARRFQAEISVRGAHIVLTHVPTMAVQPGQAQQFARALNVPFVSPRVDGLATFDGSHLMSESARRFTAAFAAELDPLLTSPAGEPPAVAARRAV